MIWLLKTFGFVSKSSQMLKFPRKYKFKFSTINFTQPKYVSYAHVKYPARRTIFALSTASGMSAIAVIRISGPNASDVLFKMGKLNKLPEARKAILCRIRDPLSGELLDKALLLWFPSPNSFTGEDMCEFHVHGGIAVIKSILHALPKLHHFRMAEPGEFTKRAFMANKLDLTEVEGIADLLHAETEIQQRQALRQMDGVLNKLYNDWTSRIKKCLASVEAYIDFSEDQHLEDTILKTVQRDLCKLEEEMKGFVSDYRRGERLKNGINTVLIGRPNVGKSSLLNIMCQRDIAIVSPVAGTTRDIIETSFNLDGYLVNISDTAGIRETKDLVELEGVNRAKKRSTNADLMLFILEAKTVLKITSLCSVSNEHFIDNLLKSELGEPFIKETNLFSCGEKSTINTTDSNNVIILVNKIDLLTEEERTKLNELEDMYPFLCAISCTEGLGFDKFLNLFTNTVKEMCSGHKGEEPIITRERHRVYITNCLQHIISYNEYVNIDIAIAAEKLRSAMNELSKITGKVRVDDILDIVFKDFCIGK